MLSTRNSFRENVLEPQPLNSRITGSGGRTSSPLRNEPIQPVSAVPVASEPSKPVPVVSKPIPKMNIVEKLVSRTPTIQTTGVVSIPSVVKPVQTMAATSNPPYQPQAGIGGAVAEKVLDWTGQIIGGVGNQVRGMEMPTVNTSSELKLNPVTMGFIGLVLLLILKKK